jgi:hypothetical protein
MDKKIKKKLKKLNTFYATNYGPRLPNPHATTLVIVIIIEIYVGMDTICSRVLVGVCCLKMYYDVK